MIDDRELSVVVQGPLLSGQEEGIARCLDSVRRVLPGAEVVVSTWENEDARAIAPPVRVVQSPDPGGFPLELERPYNLNRLQRSTAAGLAAATRRYCLKLRTDLAVADRRFLALGARRDGCLFEEPVTMSNLYIRDPEKFPLLFHISDIAQFGLTRDLREFWEGGLFDEKEVLYPREGGYQGYTRIRIFPEQATTLRWLRRKGVVVELRNPSEVTRALLRQWGEVLAQNFHVVDWRKSGIVFPKRFETDPASYRTLLSEEKAAALPARGFVYWRARLHGAILGGLLRGRLAALIGRARARSPLVNRALRWLWASYHGLSD